VKLEYGNTRVILLVNVGGAALSNLADKVFGGYSRLACSSSVARGSISRHA